MQICNRCEDKKLLKYPTFWGDVPADFSTGGGVRDASSVPPPPAFGANEPPQYQHLPALFLTDVPSHSV